MGKAIFITEMPKNCYNCPYCDVSGGDGDWWCILEEQYLPFENSESEERDLCCPLKPYQKAIPIEWLHSIMERQLIFAMNSEMEGTTTVKDGVIHCVSGALACQVLANVIELWEKENANTN